MQETNLQQFGRWYSIPGWRALLIVACILVLVFELYLQAKPHSYIYFSDFQNDYNAARALRHGANPLAPAAAWVRTYVPGSNRIPPAGGVYYTYAPIFALLLVPLTFLPLQAALIVWDFCSLLCLLGAVYACLRSAGVRPSAVSFLVLSTAMALLQMVRVEYSLGQVDIFLMFVVCAAIWARQADRPVVAGLLLAFACVTKPVLLPFAAFLLWKRDFKLVAVTVGAFFALLLAPFVWLGGQALRDQIDIWRYWSSEYAPFIYNYAPRGILARLFSLNAYVQPIFEAPALVTVLWLVNAVVVGGITVAVAGSRPLRRYSGALMEFGLVASAALLISPLTELGYMVLLVIPFVACYLCIRELDWRSPSVLMTAAGILLIWLLFCGLIGRVPLPRLGGGSALAKLYTVGFADSVYIYLVLGVFALQLHLMHLASGRSTIRAIRECVWRASKLAKVWLAGDRSAGTRPMQRYGSVSDKSIEQ